MEYISKEIGQGRSSSYYDKGRSRTNVKNYLHRVKYSQMEVKLSQINHTTGHKYSPNLK